MQSKSNYFHTNLTSIHRLSYIFIRQHLSESFCWDTELSSGFTLVPHCCMQWLSDPLHLDVYQKTSLFTRSQRLSRVYDS